MPEDADNNQQKVALKSVVPKPSRGTRPYPTKTRSGWKLPCSTVPMAISDPARVA